LAESLVTVAQGAGLATTALITDMDQVLGRTAGNALEVIEAIALLRGEPCDPRLAEVTLALSADLLPLGRLAANAEEARRKLAAALDSGQAAERFARMVAALGGPADLLERADAYLPKAPVSEPVFAERSGYVGAMDTRAIGWLIVALGGGRRQVGDPIDYAVGLSDVCQIGEWVDRQRPLARVHARDAAPVVMAATVLRTAIRVTAAVPAARSLFHGRLGSI
jgi:thymidine phosphorylase